ncbi:DUF2786 domain-containing protein [Streptomyces sp. NPDC006984]|uniref:DUF2786 domain-containing protein n=1 Tax=Streptomyces sp. NPDC006984 TaxID=3155463 RepID=UPI0033C5A512
MGTVSTVEKALAAALYAEGDAPLDAAASLLAADPGADAELRRRGEELLRRAWERGWQPADVARLVRRDLGEVHHRLLAELIAAESAHYGPRLPHRWEAQLRDLAGEVPPPSRGDRFGRATAVLELYRLLARLPSIEAVAPPPGAGPWAAPAPGREGTGREPRMLTRVRALLAKAEATGYPQEAEALTAKAQELMARHSIDEAVLAQGAPAAHTPSARRIGVDAPYETAKAVLLDVVSSANRCKAVWNGAFGFSTVVGFEGDLEAVELLYTSLLVQGTRAMTTAESAQRAGGRKRTRTFRQSFWTAYASRIGEHLAAVAEEAVPGELLPVLATRDLAVADRTRRMFPETRTARVRAATDAAGWRDGTSAADRAQRAAPGRPLPGRRA